MIRRPPRSTQSRSSAASDVYKRQVLRPDDLELLDGRLREGEWCTRAAGLRAVEVVVRACAVDVEVGGERARAIRGDRVRVERAGADTGRQRGQGAEVPAEEREAVDLLAV